jgi:hypothetical protein
VTYKNYDAVVEFDEEAGVFTGEVINTRDVITFQGKSGETVLRQRSGAHATGVTPAGGHRGAARRKEPQCIHGGAIKTAEHDGGLKASAGGARHER